MKTYLFTSTRMEGEIELVYAENGYLMQYDCRAKMTDEQHYWFLKKMPRTIEDLIEYVKDVPTITLVEKKKEITFLDFWNSYNDKLNSSKKRTEKAWEKMTKANQIAAYNFIPKYIAHLPPGVRKKYAETYLNAELWNN